MTRYALKDKARQAKLDALSDTNKFSERLSEDYEKANLKGLDHVCVYFGKRVTIRNGIEGTQHKRFSMMVTIPMSEIEIIDPVEILKPYVWYPREKWDGNPKRYMLVEYDQYDCLRSYCEGIYRLNEITTKFMYIERPSGGEK